VSLFQNSSRALKQSYFLTKRKKTGKNTIFFAQNKAKPVLNPLYISMRKIRLLAQGVWYEVRTSVNDTEPLFWSRPNQDLFKQGLYEIRQIYGFSLSGLRFSGPEVSFYIKPADGRAGGVFRRAAWEAVGNAVPRRAVRRGT
jgi:hypothetical protein